MLPDARRPGNVVYAGCASNVLRGAATPPHGFPSATFGCSADAFVLLGIDENFRERSSANVGIANLGLNIRPADQLRISGTWYHE